MVLRLSEVLAAGDLALLNKETLDLIRQGSWSLLKTADGYAVRTPRQNQCCNRHPQQTFLVDHRGACTGQGSSADGEIVWPDGCLPGALHGLGKTTQ